MKYAAIMKKPCEFMSCTPQRQAWEDATPEKDPEYFMAVRFFVSGGNIYLFKPKHTVGVHMPRAAGGKWEKVNPSVVKSHGGVDAYMANLGAVPANFRGEPKL